MRRVPRMKGFTTTEMMVVVGIIAILAAIAAPGMQGMIRNQRVKGAAFDVFASFTFARSEAIKRNSSVTITPVSGTDWSKGWQVRDANNTVLRQQSGWDTLTATGPAAVTFNSTGRATALSQVALSASGTSTARCVILDLSGRATSKEGSC